VLLLLLLLLLLLPLPPPLPPLLLLPLLLVVAVMAVALAAADVLPSTNTSPHMASSFIVMEHSCMKIRLSAVTTMLTRLVWKPQN
jgi:hypothetical protein